MENVAKVDQGNASSPKSDYQQASDEVGLLKTSRQRQLRRQRIHTVHCYIAQTTVCAVAASAAILSSEEDDTDSSTLNFTCLTFLQECLASIAEAIGRPPRMPLLEQNGSTSLLWAVDLCLLSTLVAAFYLLWAFLGSPAEDEEPKSVSEEPFAERVLMRCRVLIVMILSALAGGFLNVKHSIHSALFLAL